MDKTYRIPRDQALRMTDPAQHAKLLVKASDIGVTNPEDATWILLALALGADSSVTAATAIFEQANNRSATIQRALSEHISSFKTVIRHAQDDFSISLKEGTTQAITNVTTPVIAQIAGTFDQGKLDLAEAIENAGSDAQGKLLKSANRLIGHFDDANKDLVKSAKNLAYQFDHVLSAKQTATVNEWSELTKKAVVDSIASERTVNHIAGALIGVMFSIAGVIMCYVYLDHTQRISPYPIMTGRSGSQACHVVPYFDGIKNAYVCALQHVKQPAHTVKQ